MEQVTLNNDPTKQAITKVGAVELVLFKLKEGVSEAQGLEAMTSLNDFVSKQAGFISRKLSKASNDSWVDLVFWESMQAARQASELVMQSDDCLEAFKVLDEKNMQMIHATPVLDTDA